ncbi:MAG TPA: peroxide stress protein YaaA [Azospira sp.]|nr:peroxide stress protein YaaA [Azospira sp.]
MIFVISPAKSLDFDTPPVTAEYSQPVFLDRSQVLVQRLRELSPADLSRLMDISDALAVLNVTRYAEWAPPFTPANAKQALLAFNGDVYEGLDASSLGEKALAWCQAHLRILSGLYGLLKPLDLIQPYRLEMGTRLSNVGGNNLYAFWGETITQALNAELPSSGPAVLVNLASEEYFKAVRPKALKARIVNCVFEDWKNGRYKIISFYAKRARGLMVRYAASHGLSQPEGLQGFNLEGYAFVPEISDADTYIFRRRVEG